MIILYGYGISNKSVEKYLINKSLLYQVIEDNDNSIINYEDVDLIIKSPGIKNDTLFLKMARHYNIKIVTDIEFLYYCLVKENINNLIISITGSNGKTTTVSILKSVLEEFYTCGNIGNGLFDNVTLYEKYLIECSSYMLEYANTFKPHIHCILNLEKHHISHHGSFINYIKAKIKPLKNMNENDLFVYDNDNLLLKRISEVYICKSESFSLNKISSSCYMNDNVIFYHGNQYLKVDEINIKGLHNYKNIMACIIILKYLKISDKQILRIKYFKPLSHRLEIIKTNKYESTIFINDSKSTSPYAMHEAIKFVEKEYPMNNVILLVGGKKENIDYRLFNISSDKISKVYSFGEINNYVENVNKKFRSLHELLTFLKQENLKEKVVLFSPGAPSLDEFNSYIERGEYFKSSFLN